MSDSLFNPSHQIFIHRYPPTETVPGLLPSYCMTDGPALSSSLWPLTGLSPVNPCFYCTGEPRTQPWGYHVPQPATGTFLSAVQVALAFA